MEFLNLMPMADAFIRRSKNEQTYDEEERQRITDEIWKRRYTLLHGTGYDATRIKRDDRVEDALAVKALFILGRKLHGKRIDTNTLKYLVSDQTSLFFEGDQSYRSERLRKESSSEKKLADRERHTPQYTDACVDAAVEVFNTSCVSGRTPGESKLAEEIIRTIVHYVVTDRNGKSINNWLFKESHLGVTDQNREQYENECKRFKIDFPLSFTRRSEKRIIKNLKEERLEHKESETTYWMISPALFRKEDFLSRYFDSIPLDESGKDEFAFKIILALAYGYLSFEKFITSAGWGIVPKRRRTITDAEVHEFKKFEKRLRILAELETGYLKKRESLLTKQHDFTSYPSAAKKYIKVSEKLVGLVYSFYENLGIPLIHDKENSEYLAWRISGVINMVVRKRATMQNHNLIPIALLLMIKSCGLNICRNRLVEVDVASTHARFRKELPLGAQRYAEIQFLDDVCSFLNNRPIEFVPGKALEMSEEDIFLNFQEYLLRQGWEIKSKQELDLWSSILQNRCEKIPLIGYQIKFLDYITSCFPTHYEFLPYQVLGPYNIRPNYFYSIYFEKEQEIKKSANSIVLEQSNYKEVIESYKKIWSDFSLKYEERRDKVNTDIKIPFPLSLFCPPKDKSFDIENFDNSEYCKYYFYYKSIIAEMIMQEAINNMSRQKLIDDFSRAYGVTLKHALNDSIRTQ